MKRIALSLALLAATAACGGATPTETTPALSAEAVAGGRSDDHLGEGPYGHGGHSDHEGPGSGNGNGAGGTAATLGEDPHGSGSGRGAGGLGSGTGG